MSSIYTEVNKKTILICIKTNKSIWEERASKSSIIIAIIKSFQRLTTALSNARVEIKRLTLYLESTKINLKKRVK